MAGTKQLSYFGEFEGDYFSGAISKEFFRMLIGEPMGYGIGRVVYAAEYDKTVVLKFEPGAKSFQNVHEWDLWKQHSEAGTSTADWLAPCVAISECGSILVQKKTKPVPWSFKLPKKVPNVINCDMKRDNWGLYKGKLVCHDYGRHDAISLASRARGGPNMVRANWLAINRHMHFIQNYGQGST